MCALYVDDSSPVGVECSLAPGSSGTPPADLPVPGAPVEPEPVAADVDAHLPLFTEAVGSEGVDASPDQANCKTKTSYYLVLISCFL